MPALREGAAALESRRQSAATLLAALFLSAVSGPAAAGEAANPREGDLRVAVVAFGRCEEAPLAEATRALRRELSEARADATLDEAETAEAGGGLCTASLAEVTRKIESGRTDFLNLDMARARETLRSVLPEIDRLPIGPARWEAYWSTRIHLARVLQYDEQRPKASERLLEILKVQEDFALNRVEYPPSTRELLELTRSLMAGLPRFKLRVVSDGSGEPVFINGYPVGKTPFEKRMASGTYAIVVGEPQRHPLVRRVALKSELVLEVAPEREAGFRPDHGPCYEAGAEPGDHLGRVAALAPVLGVDGVVAVRIEERSGERYVTAALVEVAGGHEVRKGRVRFAPSGLPPLTGLARFVLTGEGPVEGVELAETAASPPPREAAARSESSLWKGATACVLAGAALVVGGIAVYQHRRAAALGGEADALLRNGALSHADKPRYDELRSDSAAAARLRNGLAIGAAASAAGSGVFFGLALLPAKEKHEVAFAVGVAGNF